MSYEFKLDIFFKKNEEVGLPTIMQRFTPLLCFLLCFFNFKILDMLHQCGTAYLFVFLKKKLSNLAKNYLDVIFFYSPLKYSFKNFFLKNCLIKLFLR
jgi:hypothetical protein